MICIMFDELLLDAMDRGWSRTFVRVRAAAILILAIFFRHQFVALLEWIGHVRASAVLDHLPTSTPTPQPSP